MLKNLTQNWSLSRKLTTIIGSSAIAVGLITGIGVSTISSMQMLKVVEGDIKQVSGDTTKMLKAHMEAVREDLLANAKSSVTARIIEEFNDGWNSLPGNAGQYLQTAYVNENPNPAGQRDKLVSANDGSYYSEIHRAYHAHFLAQKNAKEYYDIFLFNTEGDLIYSVYKDADFATNFESGKWSDTGLGAVFRKAKAANERGSVAFEDFQYYEPANNTPASFISSPVFNAENKFIGVIAYQLPVKKFNDVFFLNNANMTAYVVSSEDGILRSDSPKTEVNDILTTKARIANLEDFVGKTIENQPSIYFDSSTYAVKKVEFEGTTWYSIIEMNTDIIADKVGQMQIWALVLSTLTSIVAAIIGYFLSKRFSSPVEKLADTVEKLSQGYSVDIPCRDQGDEIGKLARSMTHISNQAIASARIETAVEESRSSLMLADIEGKIIYNNKTIFNKLNDSREFLNLHMPRLNIDDLTQSYIYDFHGDNYDELQNKLTNMQEPYVSELTFDDRYFDSVVRPVHDKSGNHIGFVSEWREKTGEVKDAREKAELRANEEKIESQVAKVIEQAASGNFKTHIEVQSNEREFIKIVSNGINQICSGVDKFFNELNATVECFANGDLTEAIQGDYSGQYEEVKTNLNASFSKLSNTIKQITTVGVGIRSASTDITQGADDLSSRTEAQAASI
ncbi:MAG: HAMP domain-containing protein, partial [Pseudomonadota bacterium]